MLILSNEEVASLVTAAECVQWLEEAYRDQAANEAGSIPRADLIAPLAEAVPGSYYAFKTMSGTLPRKGITALRLNSDVLTWPQDGEQGTVRRVKLPAAPGGRWVGLVMLFSNVTGEPLALFPDGILQRLRVGATSALAARVLSRPESSTVGLLGAGWQAGGQVLALQAVRPLKLVKVYSPNPESRRRFVEAMRSQVSCEIQAVDSPEQAADGADILACATNSLDPVVQTRWLTPGMHVSCVKRTELSAETFQYCDVLVQHVRRGVDRYVLGHQPIPEEGREERAPSLARSAIRVDWTAVPELSLVIAGKVAGRTSPSQITCFCNNIGTGLQFAAVGAHVYERARQHGLGRELPTEWFTEDVHP